MRSILLLLAVCATAHAAPIVFESSARRTALLELYTSEGCSSCPPAETHLSAWKNSADLWTKFVPVAFHVDYWNYLGWRDKLSDAQFSERQRSYAKLWSTESIYTPEFVLNGQEWHDWFGLRGAPGSTAEDAGKLRVSSEDGKHWQVNYVPPQNGTTNYEITVAELVSDLQSDVQAGENSGRHLRHDFAALSLATRPLVNHNSEFQGSFVVEPNLRGVDGRFALAVWITLPGQLEPLQATGGWLPSSKQ
jgi:hypothetical protein